MLALARCGQVSSPARDQPILCTMFHQEDRPRERAAVLGVEALSTVELVSVLLSTSGRPGSSVADVARDLLAEHGSLARLSTASIADLNRTTGIGPAKSTTLSAAFELGRRAAAEGAAVSKLASSGAIAAAAAPLLAGRRERLLVLSADHALRLHGTDLISQGGTHSTAAPVRDILAAVLRRDCSTFALAHRHPAGDPTPSSQDITATARIADAAKVVGLRLLDHVVLGGTRWRSIRTRTPD